MAFARVEIDDGAATGGQTRAGLIEVELGGASVRVTLFYNQRGTAEQHIKEGKNAIVWTRLSCRRFAANAVRLQLHALAYNLANFLRTLTLPNEVSHWSMTTLRDRLVEIGAKVVRHGRSITFQMAEVMVSHDLFQQILDAIAALRPSPLPRCRGGIPLPAWWTIDRRRASRRRPRAGNSHRNGEHIADQAANSAITGSQVLISAAGRGYRPPRCQDAPAIWEISTKQR